MKLKYIVGPFYHRLREPLIWWRMREHRNNPKHVVSEVFRYVFGRDLNWENPQDLNEKIQWLKFNSDTSAWTRLADKYAVRDYVKECGFEDMLVPLYGKWNRVRDIEWDKLPNEFIMKTNHGSNDAKICRDKSKIDLAEWRYHFKLALRRKYGWANCEPHYLAIKPCIIAEKLLDATKQVIPSSSLIDYKIWCTNGVVQYIWACYNRTASSVQVMMYDKDWNACPEMCVDTHHYRIAAQLLPPPIRSD